MRSLVTVCVSSRFSSPVAYGNVVTSRSRVHKSELRAEPSLSGGSAVGVLISRTCGTSSIASQHNTGQHSLSLALWDGYTRHSAPACSRGALFKPNFKVSPFRGAYISLSFEQLERLLQCPPGVYRRDFFSPAHTQLLLDATQVSVFVAWREQTQHWLQHAG